MDFIIERGLAIQPLSKENSKQPTPFSISTKKRITEAKETEQQISESNNANNLTKEIETSLEFFFSRHQERTKLQFTTSKKL